MITTILCYVGGVIISFVHLVLKGKKQRLKYATQLTEHEQKNNMIVPYHAPIFHELVRTSALVLALVFPFTYACVLVYNICCAIEFMFKCLVKVGTKASDKIIAFTNKPKPGLPEVQHKTYRG